MGTLGKMLFGDNRGFVLQARPEGKSGPPQMIIPHGNGQSSQPLVQLHPSWREVGESQVPGAGCAEAPCHTLGFGSFSTW